MIHKFLTTDYRRRRHEDFRQKMSFDMRIQLLACFVLYGFFILKKLLRSTRTRVWFSVVALGCFSYYSKEETYSVIVRAFVTGFLQWTVFDILISHIGMRLELKTRALIVSIFIVDCVFSRFLV